MEEVGSQKKFFPPFGPQFGLKIRGGPGAPGSPGRSPGSATTFQLTFTSNVGGSLTVVPPAVIGASISLSYLGRFVCSM